jgi:RPA family protein
MAGFSGEAARLREVAWRVFAEELRASNLAFRENEDQYAPLYLLTPTGAKCNRVFLVGTLTEKDDIGGDTEYWRGRIVDPTGSILIYAGQYQPEAAQALANIEAPAFVSVVGKPKLYQTEDGNIIISVRVEAIHKADKAARDRWILDAARRTYERLQHLQGAKPLSASASGGFSTADKTPAAAPDVDASKALEHYRTDIAQYRKMVVRALTSLSEDLAGGTVGTETAKAMAKAEAKTAPAPSADAAEPPKSKSEGRKAKPKASRESLDAWPEQEGEVETFNFGKKS